MYRNRYLFSCKAKRQALLLISICLLTAFCLQGCATAPDTSRHKVPPKEVPNRLNLAESYLSTGKYRLALRELLLIEEQAQKMPEFYYDLGLAYMGIKEWAKARDSLLKATELKSDYGEAFNVLGQVYIALGETQKAKQAFKKSLNVLTYLTPEYAAYNLARLYQNSGELHKALEYAQTAIDKKRNYAPAYILIADLLAEQSQAEKALKWLKKGVQSNPQNPGLMLRLAENHLRLGNKENALYWFQQIIQYRPSSEEAQVAQDYLDIL